MITLRKLASLAPGSRDRKVLALLRQLILRLQAVPEIAAHELDYYHRCATLALPQAKFPSLPDLSPHSVGRFCQILEAKLGVTVGDWDLQSPGDRTQPARRFDLSVWLEDLRSPFNVGSIVRTAEALGFSRVLLSNHCPGINHPRVARTAMGAETHLEVVTASLDELKKEWKGPVYALELGGTNLGAVSFPASGLLLLGSEELGLSPEALAWAESRHGRITVPLYGTKASLNVGVAFGIAASAWAEAARKAYLTSEG